MLSVVIPTRDRRATLVETLAAVLAQRTPPGGFEAVVVDNGSTDDTPAALAEAAAAHPDRVTVVRESRQGPAAARNAGAAAARGEVLMFLGDDTAPAGEDLLARHGELHAARPEPEYAVLGHVRWADDRPITPLMRWLDRGPQFAYEGLPSGFVDTAAYFYTAHVSLKKSVFDACGGFDTRFPHAAVEDIELGVRLAARGVVLDYHRDLEVLHSHPTTLERWLERMRLVGRSAALFERIHPGERNPTVSIPKGPLYACVRAAAPAVAPLDHPSAPLFLRHLRWRILHHAAYSAGYRQGPPGENGRAT